ncbi:glucan endo-1,3-beta-glucosidase 4-like [Camellia sinensis]|uniref:glucan endo-1,3-beta-glucosidase 4-like n=1 Tax=Camellia sinensis TaxID=4442 RepID=UPI0010369AF9|nr:glucan endo-1,3-beta-glucosidase 4-like [Camellia sinensis]
MATSGGDLFFLSCKHALDAEFEQWCVADDQTPDDELQAAMDWACGKGGANCSEIQVNQPCYLPNTVRDHASYAFNNYYQNFKHKGASCYFNGGAITTELDPSHNGCHFEFLP